MIWLIGAAVWGMAEASFFFLVPDILLTAALLRRGLQTAVLLSVVAAICAALTGIGMYLWGAHDLAAAQAAMLKVPAVGPDLLARVHRELGGAWPLHLVLGAVSGVPYKLYAVEAGARHVPLWLFVPVSFAARLARFVLTILLAMLGRVLLVRLGKVEWIMPVWAMAWMLVYLVYFTLRAAQGPATL
jgi:membrane protein YqaA with SNARE-associated domain